MSLFDWLIGYDKVQQGLTQNTNIAVQAVKKTDALAGQFTNLSQNVATQVAGISDTTAGLAKTTNELTGKFTGLSETSTEIAGKVTELSAQSTETAEKLAELSAQSAEAIANAEKINAVCIILAAAAVIAVTTLVAFLIYQGVKAEKEAKNNLSNDNLSNAPSVDTEETPYENGEVEDLSTSNSLTGSLKDLNLNQVKPEVLQAA